LKQRQSTASPESEESDDEFVKLVNDHQLLSGKHFSRVCIAFVAESLFLNVYTLW